MTKFTDEELLTHKIEQHLSKGIVKYHLIDDDDKILVGLSGGKDSLALLELLARRARIHIPHFTIYAAHVRISNITYKSDESYLRQFAESLGVRFISCETSFDASTDKRKRPCFLCSWNRRKVLFNIAKQLGCNKIALGHHMDDILETLLMNITFQGAFATMPPKLKMDKFDMTIIRPMCLVHEADLMKLSQMRGYQKQLMLCPYEKESNRAEMKKMLQKMEALNPEARYSLWKSMTNVKKDQLPDES